MPLALFVSRRAASEIERLMQWWVRYWVYYRVRQNRLEVLSVWHSSRDSGPAV